MKPTETFQLLVQFPNAVLIEARIKFSLITDKALLVASLDKTQEVFLVAGLNVTHEVLLDVSWQIADEFLLGAGLNVINKQAGI